MRYHIICNVATVWILMFQIPEAVVMPCPACVPAKALSEYKAQHIWSLSICYCAIYMSACDLSIEIRVSTDL